MNKNEEILQTHLEMYKLAESKWNELLREEKENTPLGLKWSMEMDYWWNKLPISIKQEMIKSAKDKLTVAFSSSFNFYEKRK